MQLSEGIGLRLDGELSVDLVDAPRHRPPSPAEKEELHEFAAIIVVR
jgi:hypothetical protein